MSQQPWMTLSSTDAHLIQPLNLWTDRLPEKFVDRGPQIIDRRLDNFPG